METGGRAVREVGGGERNSRRGAYDGAGIDVFALGRPSGCVASKGLKNLRVWLHPLVDIHTFVSSELFAM
jgi:hypothetical protein